MCRSETPDMATPLADTLRDRLRRYVVGELSLVEFDRWFVPATADVDRMDDPETTDLAYEVLLRLAEFSNGDWTETELKDLLRQTAMAAPTTAG
jgi:hypothetical protein